MDINELKKMLKSSTAVLVIDNGEPTFVIMDYASYKELAKCETGKEVKINGKEKQTNGYVPEGLQNGQFSARSNGESELLEKINKDILALKDEIEKEEKLTATTID